MKVIRSASRLLVIAGLLALLGGCVTAPVEIPAGLSATVMFQRAQEAEDTGNYALAIRYYTLVKKNNPGDVVHVVWSTFEIAFLTHKMGRDAEALALLTTMLDTYKDAWDGMPAETAAPRALAEKLKARLEAVPAAK